MKRTLCAIALSLAAVGCADGSADIDDTVASIESALSVGQNQGSFLTLRGSALSTSENARQLDTCNTAAPPAPCGAVGASYYTTVGVSPNGSTAGGTIASRLSTLKDFASVYGFSGNEVRTQYYNRGDLGIGRDMHCVDKLNVAGNNQIACFVKNFAAGDDGSEFTFGLSSNIAFANLEANRPFATVAMVYRDQMPIDSKNRVFFVVYDKNGALQNFAALDRHGIIFNSAFQGTKPNNPGSEFGTPGATFSNHIPSNCVSCHGGQQYVASGANAHTQVGALFLPFDLDQLEYENVAGKIRSDQEPQFRKLNQMVRKVAALSVSAANAAGTSIKNQLDTWYGNTDHRLQTDRTEVFEKPFPDTSVPVIAGWSGATDFFQTVVRPDCRNCHVSNQNQVTFDTQTQFDSTLMAGSTAALLCGWTMPHSLQTLRRFWQSGAPAALVSHFNAVGQSGAANTILGCGPGNVATLDPPEILASALTP